MLESEVSLHQDTEEQYRDHEADSHPPPNDSERTCLHLSLLREAILELLRTLGCRYRVETRDTLRASSVPAYAGATTQWPRMTGL